MKFVYCAMGKEHVLMADKSARTLKSDQKHGAFECELYCDEYNLDHHRCFPVVRPEYFKQPFMTANVMCQFDALTTADWNELVVFLDNDIVMMQPLPKLPEADLYVTWRDDVGELSKTQPYNYGVVMAWRNPNTIRAFAWLEDRVRKLSPTRQKWYGNQIALRELVGPLVKNETVERNFGYFSLKIHQLPCHKWNWSPPEDNLKQNAKDKVFVHLKGNRKEAFDYYYDKAMS